MSLFTFIAGAISTPLAAAAGACLYTWGICNSRLRQESICHDNYVAYRSCPEFEEIEAQIHFESQHPFLFVESKLRGTPIPKWHEWEKKQKKNQ